jgi:hypothetical protein
MCPSCSQNAHGKTVLVRCAQERAALATPLAIGMVKKLNWTCVVEGVRGNGMAKALSVLAQRAVAGSPRWTRAVEDQSAPIPGDNERAWRDHCQPSAIESRRKSSTDNVSARRVGAISNCFNPSATERSSYPSSRRELTSVFLRWANAAFTSPRNATSS